MIWYDIIFFYFPPLLTRGGRNEPTTPSVKSSTSAGYDFADRAGPVKWGQWMRVSLQEPALQRFKEGTTRQSLYRNLAQWSSAEWNAKFPFFHSEHESAGLIVFDWVQSFWYPAHDWEFLFTGQSPSNVKPVQNGFVLPPECRSHALQTGRHLVQRIGAVVTKELRRGATSIWRSAVATSL